MIKYNCSRATIIKGDKIMKKIISTLLVCVLLVGTMLTLTSCNMLMGTYEYEFLGKTTTAEFTIGKVTITEEYELLGKIVTDTYECKYKIEEGDDGKTITFTYEDGADEHSVFSGKNTFSEVEKDGKKSIQIGMVTLNKK